MNLEEYEHYNPFGLQTDSDFHATQRNTTLSIILNHIKNLDSPRILDVGCGVGLITKFIRQNIKGAQIDAFDISSKAIESTKTEPKNINFFEDDALIFKGFGYLYDVVILNNIYEHVENPVGILLNLKHLIDQNGILIISTPNRYFIKNILRKLFGLKIVIPEYHITEYSIGQIYDHHKYAGLKIIRIVFPKFKRERFKIVDFIVFKIIQPIIDLYFNLLRSTIGTGSLLFIISKKETS